ncbi:hypothetical protein [Haloglomus halophilum]|uniref:hypothetical protein n=1 Tax=Haloglomus halophilum TaxID=2962672 RepID=UPI0020C9F3A9|nr:hypothetical protein [Haloglomus halophilum]
MGHLRRRLRRNLGGVIRLFLTDLIWRRKNLLTLGAVGVGLTQIHAGVGLLLAGSFVASLGALFLGVGGLLAGGLSFFGRTVPGGIGLGLVVFLIVAGPGVVLGVADTAHSTADESLDTLGTQPTETPVNDTTTFADGPSYDDDDRVGGGFRDGDTAADGCGTNDGDPDYNEDNDRDNDGLCDE